MGAGSQGGDQALNLRAGAQTLSLLWPYVRRWRGRFLLALACMVAAKLAVVAVPIVLGRLVDRLAIDQAPMSAVLPLSLIVAYGALRLSTSLLTELREFFFARVTRAAERSLALRAFEHLHALSLRFHLDRQTGALIRQIDHGVRAVGSLVSFTLYSIVPTVIELALVMAYLLWHYEVYFALIVGVSVLLYVVFTFGVTQWRTRFRRQMNELDAKASAQAMDSLLNFETVKYFNNASYEAGRYDAVLAEQERAAIKTQQSLSALNAGQQLIVAAGLTLVLWRAAVGVQSGQMSVGDLVLINAFMMQLYAPLNFLGVIYRQIRQSVIDLERMFVLLAAPNDVPDAPTAAPLRAGEGHVRFEHVGFAYRPERAVLTDVSFELVPGKTTAIVGTTGSGKSTLARLLFRFYDPQHGRITVDGQDLREITQQSLREILAIVAQEPVLFNDTLAHNIAYGKPGASAQEVEAAARLAALHEFVMSLPQGYQTMVGERGLKLSGGEKQRVAIARALLKHPKILVFDEATSALDSRTERAILQQIKNLARGHTSLVIAHRLSTVAYADEIIVLEAGRIVQRGTHAQLLAASEGRYAQLWSAQSASGAQS